MRRTPIISLITALSLLTSLMLGGCNEIRTPAEEEKNLFIGTWQNTTAYPGIIQFFPDGSCMYGGESGKWNLKDNKVTIELPELALIHQYNYWFSNNNQTLLLTKTFGYSLQYTKQ